MKRITLSNGLTLVRAYDSYWLIFESATKKTAMINLLSLAGGPGTRETILEWIKETIDKCN